MVSGRSATGGLGGNRRGRRPSGSCTAESLRERLEAHVNLVGTDKAFDVKSYLTMPRAYAIRPADMIHCTAIIMALGCKTIAYSVLQSALKDVALTHPDLVRSWLPGMKKAPTPQEWSSKIADSLQVLLAHVRRLEDETRWRQATQSLTESQKTKLAVLRSCAWVLEDSLQGEEEDSQAAGSSTAPPVPASPQPTPGRRLRPQASDVSVDQLGFPQLLADGADGAAGLASPAAKSVASSIPYDLQGWPEVSPESARLLQEALGAEALPGRKTQTKREAKGNKEATAKAEAEARAQAKALAKAQAKAKSAVGKSKAKAKAKSAAGKSKAKAKAKAAVAKGKAKAKAKKEPKAAAPKAKAQARPPAEPPRRPDPVETQSFGRVKFTVASLQSYIQFKDESNSWRLLVCCNAAQANKHGKTHADCIIHLAEFVVDAPNKDAVITERDAWLKA